MHAIPASDAEEYQGMPMFAEVGPLVLDPKTTEQVNFFISSPSSERVAFPATLDKVSPAPQAKLPNKL